MILIKLFTVQYCIDNYVIIEVVTQLGQFNWDAMCSAHSGAQGRNCLHSDVGEAYVCVWHRRSAALNLG